MARDDEGSSVLEVLEVLYDELLSPLLCLHDLNVVPRCSLRVFLITVVMTEIFDNWSMRDRGVLDVYVVAYNRLCAERLYAGANAAIKRCLCDVPGS